MVGIIIQARMGSTRLPGKVLKPIGNKTLLEHILFRLSKLEYSVYVVIATSECSKDDVIEVFCREHHVDCFRGSESDVLERYYFCARQYRFDHIVRLTADNPFVGIEELDRLITLHVESGADYSRSFAVLPKGVGSEIFTFYALEKSYQYGHKENHKEHVNEYIEEHEADFRISELQVSGSENRPDISLTVDTPEDYAKACYIAKQSPHEYILTKEAIALCSQYV